MYKLNTIQGHSFLNFQAPLNYFSKRKLFQLANEIKPRKEILLVEQYFPHLFRKVSGSEITTKKSSQQSQNTEPRLFQEKRGSRMSTTLHNQSKYTQSFQEMEKYRNLMLENNYHVQMSREHSQFLIPNKQSSPPKSQRGSFMYSQQQQCLFEHRTSQQSKLKRVSRQTSNRKDDSMRSIDRHFQDIDCQQSNFNHSYIQDKMIPSNQITPRNRFFKDCFRLYGIDSQVLAPKIN